MLCKICNINESSPLASYKGLCRACRTRRYAYSKGKHCVDCGQAIANKSIDRCLSCYRKHMYPLVTRNCMECGISYQTKKKLRKKFCSRKCSITYQSRQMKRGGRYAISYKGTPTLEKSGYVTMFVRDHRRRRRVHILKAEQILGRGLRYGECVHHINLDKSDNRNANLLICTQKYHRWLHGQMERAWVRSHLTEENLIR